MTYRQQDVGALQQPLHQNNVNAGTAQVILLVDTQQNNDFTGARTENFTIAPKDIALCQGEVTGGCDVYRPSDRAQMWKSKTAIERCGARPGLYSGLPG